GVAAVAHCMEHDRRMPLPRRCREDQVRLLGVYHAPEVFRASRVAGGLPTAGVRHQLLRALHVFRHDVADGDDVHVLDPQKVLHVSGALVTDAHEPDADTLQRLAAEERVVRGSRQRELRSLDASRMHPVGTEGQSRAGYRRSANEVSPVHLLAHLCYPVDVKLQSNRFAAGPAEVCMKRASAARSGNRDRYADAHRCWKDPAVSSGTRAHTLPPKPAPNADAATAPSFLAARARKLVSGIWFPSSSSARRCERSTSEPNRSRSPRCSASAARGIISPSSAMNCLTRASSSAAS